SDCVPFRDYANTIKRMDEEASLKEMDYTALKTLQFVAGLQDPSLREVRLRMLRRLDTQAEDASLTIEDLVADCENFTALKMDNANMESSHDVHAVQKKKVKCFKCGGPHYRNVCPLLANPPKMSSQIPKKQRRQHYRRKRNQCKNIATFAAENARTYINVDVRGHSIRFQLDTGTDITLISRRTWRKLGSPLLESCTMPVKTADGSPMKIDGRFSTDFSVKDHTTGNQFRGSGYCYVTESTNLLGLEWCVQLPAYKQLQEKYHCRMVSEADTIRSALVADLKKQYAEIFKCELGRCKKRKAKLFLREGAVPVFKKRRPVPYASIPELDAEIDRLVSNGVISPVDHSEWAAPIVAVKKKNGQIRLCADFSTGLNDALQLHQHPLPTAEEVFTRLNGGQIFSQIDLADAYLQVEVEEKSKEMLTINTHTRDYTVIIVYPSESNQHLAFFNTLWIR
ncbi:hypothetical protein TELCIR_24179, partial [Teladorsagia circumcincta]